MRFLVLLLAYLLAQAPVPQFDAASIKPNPSPSLRHVILPPVGGRLSTRFAPLGLLVGYAYGVQSYQIAGGPEWMNSAGFDLEAKAEGNPPESQVRQMLQSLLEDRFRLRVHRENRESPVYFLTPAKTGLHLHEPKPGDCTDLGAVPAAPGSPPHPITGVCGKLLIGGSPGGMLVRGRRIAMPELTRVLSGIFDRAVIDRSGAAGEFDVDLPFSYDESTTGIPKPQGSVERSQDENFPSLPTALQKQLGLRLESGRAPVEVLVVDRAERPSAN